MREHRGAIVFGLSWLVWSLVIGGLLWGAPTLLPESQPYSLRNGMFLVPVISAMLAARGIGWRRKLTFAGLTFAIFVLADVVAALTGLQGISVNSRLFGTGFWESALVVGYSVFILAYPLVCLAFFVGKRPALLWERP